MGSAESDSPDIVTLAPELKNGCIVVTAACGSALLPDRRLTAISDEIEGYAKLIALGHVSVVEVKGVTFCGKSDASNLNMSNTPWHHEVVELTRTLKLELEKLQSEDGYQDLPKYDLACEHKHSCSVLLARVDQFAVDDPATGKRTWKTWKDYGKFHELVAHVEDDPSFTLQVEDYTAETPEWALFGASEEGSDPTDTRHRKEKKIPRYTKFDERGNPNRMSLVVLEAEVTSTLVN